MKRLISLFVAIILLATIFTSCSSKSNNINFVYPFSGDVNSYDPQVASTTDEFLIVENVYEGLIRINDDGTVKPGVANKWSISDDGLIYTFNIAEKQYWHFNDKVKEMMGEDFNPEITANDFVFALQRTVSKSTDCKLYSLFSSIKNADKIHSGLISKNNLGVKATSKYTLQIELESPNSSFMNSLTTSAAMPCNEEFFNATKGRYGLSTKYSMFNGQFYLDQVLESSYLLKQNKDYKGPSPTVAYELTLTIPDSSLSESKIEENTVKYLKDGYYDAAIISGLSSDSIENDSGITLTEYTNCTWAFILNANDAILSSKNYRKALCYGFTHIKDTGKEYLNDATSLTPLSCKFSSLNTKNAIGKTTIDQNQNISKDSWLKALEANEPDSLTIEILTPKSMEDVVKQMLQGVQSGIGSSLTYNEDEKVNLSIKVNAVNDDEFKSTISSGQYQVAFYPFESKNSSGIEFLKSLSSNNLTGFDSKKYDSLLKKAQESNSENTTINYVKQAEKEYINSYCICPMLAETNYYASAKGIKNIQFHPGSGRVSFVYATREE